jgi:hypothetical protein
VVTKGARYRVGPRRRFREHNPGDEFEAILDPLHERRALLRGDIVVVERFVFTLAPGSFALPRDWIPTHE